MLNPLQCVNISSVLKLWQYEKFLAKAATEALEDNLRLKFQTARSKFQKEVFNSSLEGTRRDVWCEKTRGQSERVQNSRLTLSHWALWKLSHNSSPAVISSSSLPCRPLFFFCRRQRQFPAEERGWNPRPRTTSNTHQERQIFPEPPPPQYGHVLDQIWGQYLGMWVINRLFFFLWCYEWNKLLNITLFGGWVWVTAAAR